MTSAIEHIGIAVRNLEESLSLYTKIFSLQPADIHREVVEEQQVRIASFTIGQVRLELTEATESTSAIARFIEKRGEGIHHIAVRVDGIEQKLQELKNLGIQCINETPVVGAHDMKIAFLHPKSTGGVLMELCEQR